MIQLSKVYKFAPCAGKYETLTPDKAFHPEDNGPHTPQFHRNGYFIIWHADPYPSFSLSEAFRTTLCAGKIRNLNARQGLSPRGYRPVNLRVACPSLQPLGSQPAWESRLAENRIRSTPTERRATSGVLSAHVRKGATEITDFTPYGTSLGVLCC
jgi:hypothetical protein